MIGCDSDGAAEALFLRQYSADITLMPLSHPELSLAQAREMAEAGIVVESSALVQLDPRDDRMDVRLEGRETPFSFDVVYPALGCRPRAELAAGLRIELCDGGCVPVGAVKDSGVPGFFAAGDVVEGLDQISVAMAATNAHNWLRERTAKRFRRRLELRVTRKLRNSGTVRCTTRFLKGVERRPSRT